MTDEEACRRLVTRKAVEGWGTRPQWRGVWDETCAADFTSFFCGFPEPICGLEAAKAFSAELFVGFPDLDQEITGLIADGTGAAYRHRLRGRHLGPFLGLAPTGRPVDITGMTWCEVREGRIVAEWYELNHAELQRQLGAAG